MFLMRLVCYQKYCAIINNVHHPHEPPSSNRTSIIHTNLHHPLEPPSSIWTCRSKTWPKSVQHCIFNLKDYLVIELQDPNVPVPLRNIALFTACSNDYRPVANPIPQALPKPKCLQCPVTISRNDGSLHILPETTPPLLLFPSHSDSWHGQRILILRQHFVQEPVFSSVMVRCLATFMVYVILGNVL